LVGSVSVSRGSDSHNPKTRGFCNIFVTSEKTGRVCNDLITILISSACRLDNVNSDILDSISLSIRYERYAITRPQCQTPMIRSGYK
jgi:hypothetical protein